MTPEQEKKATEFVACYDGEWGIFANHLAEARQISRAEALTVIMAIQIGAMRDEFTRQRHPEFREDCKHCQDQERRLAITERYMQASMKFIEENGEPHEDWHP